MPDFKVTIEEIRTKERRCLDFYMHSGGAAAQRIRRHIRKSYPGFRVVKMLIKR